MTTENNHVPSFLGGEPSPTPPTKEEQRHLAQQVLEGAQKALINEKQKVEGAQKAKDEAQAILTAAKPNIMMAEANVKMAEARLLQFGSLPRASSANTEDLFSKVLSVLHASPKQMTVDEIRVALSVSGVTSTNDNLKAYCSRWSQTGAIVKGEKNHRLEPARYYAPPVPNGVPGFLSGKATAAPAEFPEDFPGREPLMEAGYSSPADLTGKTLEDLTAVPGIGKTTANKILAAV